MNYMATFHAENFLEVLWYLCKKGPAKLKCVILRPYQFTPGNRPAKNSSTNRRFISIIVDWRVRTLKKARKAVALLFQPFRSIVWPKHYVNLMVLNFWHLYCSHYWIGWFKIPCKMKQICCCVIRTGGTKE